METRARKGRERNIADEVRDAPNRVSEADESAMKIVVCLMNPYITGSVIFLMEDIRSLPRVFLKRVVAGAYCLSHYPIRKT